jgi:hypothetical protein
MLSAATYSLLPTTSPAPISAPCLPRTPWFLEQDAQALPPLIVRLPILTNLR